MSAFSLRYFPSLPPAARGRGLALRWGLLALLALPPRLVHGCACGCGVYEVGTSAMFPTGAGQMLTFENDFQDQDANWSGSSRAASSANPDKDIRTDFLTGSWQTMFTRSWGLQLEVPYDTRTFRTTGGASGNDGVNLNWSSLGDIRIEGIYTGWSHDLSTGLTLGVKLPTGNYTHQDAFGDIDRDSEIGTGSTDALLGAFHRGDLTGGNRWIWFVQAEADLPFATRDQYRPGAEIDTAAGLYFNGWALGGTTVTPVAQFKASERASDAGSNAANPVASGFARVLAAPGLEFDLHPLRIYADVELPVWQHFTGNQLAAAVLTKVSVSYMF
jgi:hypothetical protein